MRAEFTGVGVEVVGDEFGGVAFASLAGDLDDGGAGAPGRAVEEGVQGGGGHEHAVLHLAGRGQEVGQRGPAAWRPARSSVRVRSPTGRKAARAPRSRRAAPAIPASPAFAAPRQPAVAIRSRRSSASATRCASRCWTSAGIRSSAPSSKASKAPDRLTARVPGSVGNAFPIPLRYRRLGRPIAAGAAAAARSPGRRSAAAPARSPIRRTASRP